MRRTKLSVKKFRSKSNKAMKRTKHRREHTVLRKNTERSSSRAKRKQGSLGRILRSKKRFKIPAKRAHAASLQAQKKEKKTFRLNPKLAAVPSTETYTVKNYIDGTWRVSHSRQSHQSLNPAQSRDLVATVTLSSFEDLDQAIAAARFHLTSWQQKSAEERAQILFTAAKLIEEDRENLANILVRELGMSKAEADLDVKHAIDLARYYGGKVLDLTGRYLEGAQHTDIMLKRVPVGLFVIITSWVRPLQTGVTRLFAALGLGNTVVFKPSRRASVINMMLVKILERAGLPQGVLNLVNGSGSELGSYLTGHLDVDGISFTGSSSTGKIIGGSCGARLKKHELQLSGKCAMLVMASANLDAAVVDALIGSFRGAGQYHNSTSRIIVEDSVYESFKKKLIDGMKQLVVAPGTAARVDITPLRDEAALLRAQEFIRVAKNEDHAKLVLGGERAMNGECRQGWFFQPTLIENVTPSMHVSQNEILAPIVCLMRAQNEAEAIQFANNSRYGLVASAYTQNMEQAQRIAEALTVGVVHVNQSTIATDTHVVFGGDKDSGNGCRSGRFSLDVFTKWKAISVGRK